jgi:SAM-dependent methyltransferase
MNPMHEVVKDYYGRQLTSTDDLRTSACCDAGSTPAWLKPLLARIHPEVLSRYYGCGLVCPPVLDGCRVLDLGCGSGRDVYALSQLVGAAGEVVGVDMTPEQLDVAERHRDFHAAAFGFANVRLLGGYIERLDELDLEPGSFDVIVSNCVVNLSPDKDAVLRGVHRLLKEGGEFYFSDVYADRRVPAELRNDPVLYGECLGGALYWNDFLRLATRHGFHDPRLVEDRPLQLSDPELAAAGWQSAFLLGHLPPVPHGRAGIRLRGFRPGGGVSRHRSRSSAPLHARQASPDRDRARVSGLRQYLAHASRDPVRPAFRVYRRFRAALRPLPGLRGRFAFRWSS